LHFVVVAFVVVAFVVCGHFVGLLSWFYFLFINELIRFVNVLGSLLLFLLNENIAPDIAIT
jgi:hypothetical protein